MKLTKIFTMMLVAYAFTSCSNDDNVATVDNNEDGKYALTFELNKAIQQRAVDPESQAGEYAKVNNLYIFVLDASNNVIAREAVTKAQLLQQASSSDDKIYATTFGTLTTQPAGIYVVANSSNASYATVSTLTGIKAIAHDFESQNNVYFDAPANTQPQVLLDGTGAATAKSPASVTADGRVEYEASATISPVVARFEINSIAIKAGSNIKSCTIDKVFLNNYYQNITLQATAANTPQVNMIYDVANASFPTKDVVAKDITKAATTVNAAAIPATKHVAYNILPGANMPHVVIRLKDIEYTNNTNVGLTEGWIQVTSYKVSSVDYTTLLRGTVYKMDITFNTVGEDPYSPGATLDAAIKVAPWQVVTFDDIEL